MDLEFEWDPAKANENLEKHGVAFLEALSVFADPLARIFGDADHSDEEPREIIIGHTGKPRLVVVSFTERQGRVEPDVARVFGSSKAVNRILRSVISALPTPSDDPAPVLAEKRANLRGSRRRGTDAVRRRGSSRTLESDHKVGMHG